MNLNEETFLVAEFNQCWSVINAIDERRGKFLQSFTTIVVAVMGAIAFLLLENTAPLTLSRVIEATGLILLTIFGGFAVLWILIAERKANIRYRKKVNLIRSILLGRSTDQLVQDYLNNHKHLGILIPEDSHEPQGLGSTLRLIFFFLSLQLLGLVLTLGYIWALYLVGRTP